MAYENEDCAYKRNAAMSVSSPISDELDDAWAGVPVWAVYVFAACGLLIVGVLLLDYCVIRRNALGNTCCARAKQKRPAAGHQKRSTNMLLNKMTRVPIDQDM